MHAFAIVITEYRIMPLYPAVLSCPATQTPLQLMFTSRTLKRIYMHMLNCLCAGVAVEKLHGCSE